jgi:SAM-dependent methyltransferase
VTQEPILPRRTAAELTSNDIRPLDQIGRYYSQKIDAYGATPAGVDWSCLPTQELRFVQLLKVCDFRSSFSLNDVGCGYGALLSFLHKRHRSTDVDYLGIDLSASMIAHATAGWRRRRCGQFVIGMQAPRIADYSVASGIFNVRLGIPKPNWEEIIARTLERLYETSRTGFAVNFLMDEYVEADSDNLYATAPHRWALYCCDKWCARVDVLANYGMCEFTLLVRRAPLHHLDAVRLRSAPVSRDQVPPDKSGLP